MVTDYHYGDDITKENATLTLLLQILTDSKVENADLFIVLETLCAGLSAQLLNATLKVRCLKAQITFNSN